MIHDTLLKTGLPVRYSHFPAPQKPPFLVWLGGGQYHQSADNTAYYRSEEYQVEYTYKLKDPDTEAKIEDALLTDGYRYTKSEDAYLDGEDVFIIYYTVN